MLEWRIVGSRMKRADTVHPFQSQFLLRLLLQLSSVVSSTNLDQENQYNYYEYMKHQILSILDSV